MEPIEITYATGGESFRKNGSDLCITLKDFWSWAFSDIYTNTTRGIMAEFLVAAALGIDVHVPRDTWAKFDLIYRREGIEIKSASYHQRWFQERMSNISYRIPATRGWDGETNIQEKEAKRQAFLYVLCLLKERNRSRVNPLVLDQWAFWVIPTSFFDKRERSQHSITYNSLIREVGKPIDYDEIKSRVDDLIDRKNEPVK